MISPLVIGNRPWLFSFVSQLRALAGCAPEVRMAATDREALVALFRSTGGASWHRSDNWDTDAELWKWYEIKVDTEGRVLRINLGRNNLRGTSLVICSAV